MKILRFDEAELVQNLERLSAWHRVAFAAACAERLMPAYLTYSERTGRGNPSSYVELLNQLWIALEENGMQDEEIDRVIVRCMDLTPREDDEPWDDSQVYAENASSALTYALRCWRAGYSQEAAWAARHAYEALDHYVVERDDLDLGVAGAEATVRSHPLVQAELARQRADLIELEMGSIDQCHALLERIRTRAKADAARFFGA